MRALLPWLLVLGIAGDVRAQTAELLVHFDLDRESATGCVVQTAEGPLQGIELRLRALVDVADHQVEVVGHAPCIAGGAFGAEIPVHGSANPPWQAVFGEGSSGSALIELYLPLSAAPFATTVDAYFALDAPAGADALLSVNGAPGAAPISITLRAMGVPVAPAWLLVLLAAALLALAQYAAVRPLARMLVLALVMSPLLVHAGPGDGSLRSWLTPERVASDVVGDAVSGADLLGAFAFVDATQDVLYLRVDALLAAPVCLAWPTVDPGSGYSCSQEPPPDPPPALRFALTFDDGPILGVTPSVVATLRAEGVPATFFVQGERLDTPAARALVRAVHEDPLFRVANHTFTHPAFPSLTVPQMRAEITSTTDALRAALADACYFPRFFRFPFGSTNCTAVGVAREQGLATVGTHVDPVDWCYGAGGGVCSAQDAPWLPEQYRNDMVGYALLRAQQAGGGIVLMHDTWPHTAQQLPAIIAGLRALGGSFVALDDASAFPLINASVNPPEPPACCDGAIR